MGIGLKYNFLFSERVRKRERERYQFDRGKVRLFLKANSYEDVEDSI